MNEQFLESAEFYQKRYHNFLLVAPAKSCFISISEVGFFHAGFREIAWFLVVSSVEASRKFSPDLSHKLKTVLSLRIICRENKEAKRDLLIQYAVEGEIVNRSFPANLTYQRSKSGQNSETLRSSLESGRNSIIERW